MTNDEILMGLHEAASQIEDYRATLEKRVMGKRVRYYANSVFIVSKVTVNLWTLRPEAYVTLHGPVLKKDGSQHARNRGSTKFENAKFLD